MTHAALLLTSLEAARLLRVHPKQIYRLLKRGLPALRVGDEWRFEREALLAWAAASGAGTGSGEPVASPHGVERRAPPPAASLDGQPALLAANGDCAVEELLRALVAGGGPLLGFVPADHAGAAALLAAGRVLVAGQHGAGESSVGRVSRPATDASLSGGSAAPAGPRCARIHLVRRQLGLVTRRGARLAGVSALAGKRLASRAPSAGIRRRLDAALERAGVDPARAYRHAEEYASHKDVVLALAAGRAEIGLTTAAWASAAGLSFHALDSEPYELVVPAERLGDARVITLCEVLQSRAFRRRLRDTYGYDVKRTGQIVVGQGDD